MSGAVRDLSQFDNRGFHPGRGPVVRCIWYLVSAIVFESACFPCYGPKRWLLRCFGARIGRGVVIKPHVRIKYPWRLQIGDHSWIGEDAWIDNLADVSIGSSVCVSQGVYLCTGSHDRERPAFDLITRPIALSDGCWICARATVLGGVTVHDGAIVAACSLVHADVAAGAIVGGVPASAIGT
jgi:putative colanic acid biosynthesis acetyltransferase WcaF